MNLENLIKTSEWFQNPKDDEDWLKLISLGFLTHRGVESVFRDEKVKIAIRMRAFLCVIIPPSILVPFPRTEKGFGRDSGELFYSDELYIGIEDLPDKELSFLVDVILSILPKLYEENNDPKRIFFLNGVLIRGVIHRVVYSCGNYFSGITQKSPAVREKSFLFVTKNIKEFLTRKKEVDDDDLNDADDFVEFILHLEPSMKYKIFFKRFYYPAMNELMMQGEYWKTSLSSYANALISGRKKTKSKIYDVFFLREIRHILTIGEKIPKSVGYIIFGGEYGQYGFEFLEDKLALRLLKFVIHEKNDPLRLNDLFYGISGIGDFSTKRKVILKIAEKDHKLYLFIKRLYKEYDEKFSVLREEKSKRELISKEQKNKQESVESILYASCLQ